jgi:hypothetical protein
VVAEDVTQADAVRVGGAVVDGGEFGLGDQAGAWPPRPQTTSRPVRAAAMADSVTSTLMPSQTCGRATSMTSTTVWCTGLALAGRGCI